MKTHTALEVAGWSLLKDNAVEPAPFPGKYPTRVLTIVIFHNEPPMVYIGKPSKSRLQSFVAAIRRPGVMTYSFREFDRKALVQQWSQEIVPARPGRLQAQHQLNHSYQRFLRYAYHPFDNPNAYYETFLQPFYFKTMKLGERVFRFYAPVQRMLIATHISPYKQQMESFYQQRAVPEEKKKPSMAELLRDEQIRQQEAFLRRMELDVRG